MTFVKSAFTALSLTLSLSACQTGRIMETAPCNVTDASVKCLLEYARTTLDSATDPFVQAGSAAELAIAYDVTGNKSQAAKLMTMAIEQAETITDTKMRGAAFSEILTSVAALSRTDKAEHWSRIISTQRAGLDARARAEITGKAVVIKAVHQDPKSAFKDALELPQTSEVEGYAKAITLRKIAGLLAKNGDLETAREAVDSITMSIDYYKSMARSDVARLAYKKGDEVLAQTLLDEAESVAHSLGNGYFVGAALRDIGYSYHIMDMPEKADLYVSEALVATANADKQNEKARATSRVATRLSDAGLSSRTAPILQHSFAFAKAMEAGPMKGYSYYEIAGAAGIAGQFELSKSWLESVPEIPMGSTSSIRAAAERDLAWGLARYGRTDEALSLIRRIKAPREKIQALSRVIRVIDNPDMEALPRYL